MPITVTELDEYRRGYRAGMTLAEHQAFYHDLALEFPNQNYWDSGLIAEFMDMAKPATVIELGGWDGALAAQCLARDPMIRRWDNWDLADTIPQMCDDPRYHFRHEDHWIWNRPILADCFVASHSLEHLTDQHLDDLLWALCCRFAYVDVPLEHTNQTWDGSTTTHMLTLNINQFDQKWQEAGWTILRAEHSPDNVASHVRFMEWGR